MGELGPAGGAGGAGQHGLRGELLGEGPVERSALAREQVVVDGLLDKRVAEREPAAFRCFRDQQVEVDGGP